MSKLFPLVLACVGAVCATVAAAQEKNPSYDFCVRCTAPTAAYVCTVGSGDPDPGRRVWAGFCGEKVRQSTTHQSCQATALTDACVPARVYVFKGLVANQQQADNLLSDQPENREEATKGILAQAAQSLRQTGRKIDAGARAVGRSVVDGVSAAGEGADTVSDVIVDSAKSVGRKVGKGFNCVVSLGKNC
ncbi:MAG: hypothetical protein ACTSY1_03235 [Alphaproteobacteria bacterium]